jgi:hypothetical protein
MVHVGKMEQKIFHAMGIINAENSRKKTKAPKRKKVINKSASLSKIPKTLHK